MGSTFNLRREINTETITKYDIVSKLCSQFKLKGFVRTDINGYKR